MFFKNVTPMPADVNPAGVVQWMKQHPHWCIKPFQTTQVFSHTSGDQKILSAAPCCNSYAYAERLVSADQQFNQFKQLKQNISNGIKSAECARCYQVEQTNDFSERMREVVTSVESFNDFLNNGKLDNVTFGVEFGNLCNLACRSCNSGLSTMYAKVKNLNSPNKNIEVNSPELYELVDYVKALTEKYNLVHVGLIGGETMLQPGAVQFTELLAQLEKSKNIVLRITSNFTTLNTDILKHVDSFRRVDLTASIDSTGDNYHYVRWPAQFSKIKDNVLRYRDIRRASSTLTNFSIASVFSLNNIFYIEEYIDFLQECIGQQHDTTINVLHLDQPNFLSIQNLPLEYRKHLLPYVQRALNKQAMNFHGLFPMKVFLQGVENFLQSSDDGIGNFDNFLKFTADFDRRTSCNFSKFNSRLYNILTDTDKEKYNEYARFTSDYNQTGIC